MSRVRYPKYKPTGIAWLPEVPEGWEIRPLKEMVSCNDETISELDTPNDAEIHYVEIGDVEFASGISSVSVMKFGDAPSRARRKTRVGDIIVSTVRTYLRAVAKIVCEDLIVSTGFAVLHPKTVSGDYLSYACVSSSFTDQVIAGSTGISYPAISSSKLIRCRIPLPPLPTQRAIVAYLDEKCGKIDRLVAAKEKEAALLKELKQSMIAEAVTGTTQAAQTDTARKMKPSGIPWLPEVPEGWEVKKVRQHFQLRAEKVSEKDYPPLSVAKIGVVPQLSDVALSMAEGDTRKLVREGDYVVNSRSDRKGSCGIAPRDGSVTTISIVLEPHDIERKYVHYLFRSTPWVEEFYRNGRGIVADLWTTRYQEMRNMMFPLPPLAEQREIVAYIEARAAKIDAAVKGLECEVAALKEYRERLIADVVTGQRKVV